MMIYRANLLHFRAIKQINVRGKSDQAQGLTSRPSPREINNDYIGPPEKESNLRPIVRCVPKDETNLAKTLREKQIEVERWNHDFWSRHNKRFYEEKESFVEQLKSSGIENISADGMSKFYKHFLDKNWKLHFFYNISWYMKNFDLLVLASQVNIQALWRRMRK